MLFALDARRLVNPGPKSSVSGSPAQLTLTATTLSGKLVWGSSGLPPGLQINVTSGVTSGTPTTAGRYAVTLTVGNGVATSSTRVPWQVGAAQASALKARRSP